MKQSKVDKEVSRVADQLVETKKNYSDEKYAGVIEILNSDLEIATNIARKIEESHGVEDIKIAVSKETTLLLITVVKTPKEQTGMIKVEGCLGSYVDRNIQIKIR